MTTAILPAPVQLLGIDIHPVTVDQLHAYVADVITCHDKALVLNVNVHCMNLAYENPWLRTFLNSAELVFCDGAGVRLGARLNGTHLPERITYADWVWQLAAFAEPRGLTFYFLGARPGVAAAAAARLRERHPALQIVGIRDGYFDHTAGSAENGRVIDAINTARPNILMLGMGMPLQEQWLMRNWPNLDANIALTGGAVFDYVSGSLQRAPRWMTDHGLEWLGRLAIEPRRLWRRYVIGNPLFLLRVLQAKAVASAARSS